jgi:hypothetical protein
VNPQVLAPLPAGGYDGLRRPFDRNTVEAACRALPGHDPIAAQRTLCETLATLDKSRAPDLAQLEALHVLEAHARRVSDRLLVRYVEGDAQLRSFERAVYVAAMRLCQSMVLAYEHFLPHVETARGDEWLAQASRVIVHLLFHRQVEFLLRFFRYKKRNADQWRSLHEAYRFALERDLHRHPVQAQATAAVARTPEQQYIQILLLELMNGGQFSPREAWWAYAWFARWCAGLTLRAEPREGDDVGTPAGFAVDLSGAAGASRAPMAATGATLHLDPSPLMSMIDEEIASLRESARLADDPAPARDSRIVLLAKLRMLFAPEPARIERRGERQAVTATVQAIVGLPRIVQMLRESGRSGGDAPSAPSALDEPTIQAFGGPTHSPTLAAWAAGDFGTGAVPENWQVRDRSDSGCRMRGKTADLNRVIPGSLLAIRPAEDAPWTVTTVRRLRRLMVDHVEIAVEHIGRKPRYVKMVADGGRDAAARGGSDAGLRCFGALYLPPSEAFPTLPIRTLLLPACEFKAGCSMTLLSSDASYVLRLHEPIRRELDVVWTSFTVVARTSNQHPAGHLTGAPMQGPRAGASSLARD